jgi:hypothetical protein
LRTGTGKWHGTYVFALLISAQLLVLVAMVAVSVWGWRRVTAETRVRARSGPTGIDFTISRNTALLSTPLIGLFVVIATVALADSPNRETVAALGLAVMVIFLLSHRSAVRRAAH